MERRKGRETLGRFGSTGRRTLWSPWSQVEILGRFGSRGRRILWNEVELSRLLQMGSRLRRRWRRLERSTSGLRGFQMLRRERIGGRCLRKRMKATRLRMTRMLIEREREQRVALA